MVKNAPVLTAGICTQGKKNQEHTGTKHGRKPPEAAENGSTEGERQTRGTETKLTRMTLKAGKIR